MIENRLELNKKPVYTLPDEVVVGEYGYSKDIKRYREPNFEPDICLCSWGGGIGVRPPKETALQIWIKTNNKNLIEFIKKYNWIYECSVCGNSPVLSMWKFKKIIIEEFYGVKGE